MATRENNLTQTRRSALPVPLGYTQPAGPVQYPWESATDAQRAEASECLAFVRLCWEHRGRTACTWPAAAAEVAAVHAAQFPILTRAGHHGTSALSYPNLRRWRGLLGTTADGSPKVDNRDALLAAYRRGPREPIGTEHPFVQLVAKYWLNENRLQLSEAYRLAQMEARKRNLDHPELRLSLYLVRRFFDQTAMADTVHLARKGEESFKNDRMDWIDRDWSQVPPGACLVIDHHFFDAAIRVPDLSGGWKPARPWLTACMCNRSFYFAGWQVSEVAPDSAACETALLLAIRRMDNRPPPWLYSDNGRDVLARGFVQPIVVTMTDGTVFEHSIRQALGITAITALKYNARAKVIERMFREVADKFSRYWFGYLGNRPGNRPWNGNAAWENPSALPSLQEFTEAFSWWLETRFHLEAGAYSTITGGRAPAEVFSERTTARAAMPDADLARAFWRPVARSGRDPLFQVGRGGRLRFQGRVYQDSTLWGHIGERLLVKISRLPGDDALYVHEPDGRFICRAGVKERLPAIACTPEDREKIGHAKRAQHRQLTQARTVLKALGPGGTPGAAKVGPVLDRLQIAGLLPEGSQVDQVIETMEGPAPADDTENPMAAEANPDLVRELDALRAGRTAATAAGQSDTILEGNVTMLASLTSGRQKHEWHQDGRRDNWESNL